MLMPIEAKLVEIEKELHIFLKKEQYHNRTNGSTNARKQLLLKKGLVILLEPQSTSFLRK